VTSDQIRDITRSPLPDALLLAVWAMSTGWYWYVFTVRVDAGCQVPV